MSRVCGSKAQRFLVNVVWIWMGFLLSFFAALVLPPFMVTRLGAEGYGLWSLLFSLAGYFSLVDFGFRSAIIRYTAQYCAESDGDRMNRLFSTMLVYFAGLAAFLVLLSALVSRFATSLFHTTPRYEGQLSQLIFLAGVAAAAGLLTSVFSCVLDGYQRFDLSGRVS